MSTLHFTPGAKNLLNRISLSLKAGLPTTGVPERADNERLRIGDAQPPLVWLRSSLELYDTSISKVLLTPRIAWMASVRARKVRRQFEITEAHAYAVVLVDADQEFSAETFEGASPECRYFRMDFEPWLLDGTPLHHPLPHMHYQQKGLPVSRLCRNPTNPLVDFMEYLIRSYDRDAWRDWVAQVYQGPTLKALRRANPPDKPPPSYTEMVKIHQDQDWEEAARQRHVYSAWRAAMTDEKRKMLGVVLPPGLDELDH